jgi:hypothetical protein
LSAAALARYLKTSAEGGVALCTLPDPCPRTNELNTNFICNVPPDDSMQIYANGNECCYRYVRGPDGGDARTDAPLVDARAQ